MRYLPNLESSLERGGGTDKVEKSDEQASDFERAAEQSMDDGNSVKDLEQVRMGATKVSNLTRRAAIRLPPLLYELLEANN